MGDESAVNVSLSGEEPEEPLNRFFPSPPEIDLLFI